MKKNTLLWLSVIAALFTFQVGAQNSLGTSGATILEVDDHTFTQRIRSVNLGKSNAFMAAGSVLVIANPGGGQNWIDDVELKLEAAGIPIVDTYFNTSTNPTPTLSDLMPYDAVLAFTDSNVPDAIGWGNTLAAYIDTGGGVVDATFTGNIPITGAFLPYSLYTNTSQSSSLIGIGTLNLPGDPLLDNVNSLTAGYRNTAGTVDPGAVVVAEYADGNPLIIKKENVGPNGARRVFVNFYPPSDTTGLTGAWDASTDGALVMANALNWVASDMLSPVISCPMDITIDTVSGLCSAVPNWADPVAIDVEDGVLGVTQTGGPMSGDSLAPGVYPVTYETTDSDGNTSSCTFNVTVADTEAPVAVCQDISLDLDASGMVTVTAADLDNGSSDNCGIVSSELTVFDTATTTLEVSFADNNGAAGNMFDVVGLNPITINSFDVNSNGAAGDLVDFEVYFKTGTWVGSDMTAGDWTLVGSASQVVAAGVGVGTPLGLSLGIDVAAGETVAFYVTSSDGVGVRYTNGGTVGAVWASDANLEVLEGAGKLYPFTSTFQPRNFNGSVIYDVTGPVPFSGTFDCSNTGSNVVTVTHTDASGNSTSCTSTVTISDVTAPEIVCIGEPGNTTDTTSQSPALDIVDNTTVSTAMTVADDFVITDLDVDIDIAHTWTGDMQITLESPAGTQVLIFDGSADGCSGDDLMVRFDDESANALDCQAGTADAFPEADYIPSNALAAFAGESTLGDWTLSIEDTAGGDAGILNTWALNYAHDVTGTPLEVVLDANGMFTLNAADLLFSVNEACSPMPIFAGTAPVTSSLTTTFVADNGQAGNMFDIVAINDLTIDSFDVSMDSGVTDDVEVYFKTGTWVGFDADPAAWTLLTTVTGVTSAGDNVPTPLNQTLGVNVLAGEMVAFYVTLTTTTAINYTNGTATGALFASDDNLEFYEGSGKVYPFDTTFEPRIFNGNIVYSAGGVADSMTIDLDCSMLGENLIEVTVVDASGNSSSCMATVLVKDETAPILVCVDATIELDADGFATIDPMLLVDPSSSDACGIENFGVSITEVSCSDIGTPLSVTLFVTDASGNPSSCVATVTVVDALAPVITCPADQTVDPGTGNLFYEVPDYIATAEATAIDNCTDPVSITTQDPAPGTLISDGVYTVTITGEDESGNVGSCSFELTVESVLGVESNELNSAISMYPNPAQEQVSIANSSNIQLETAEIYDLNGKLLKQVDLSTMQGEQVINISAFAPGVYVVKLTSDTASAVKRLIKK